MLFKRISIIILSLFFALGCKKADQNSSSITSPVAFGTGVWVADIPVPTTTSVQELFKSDKYKLDELMYSQNQDSATSYVYTLAN